MRPSLGAWRCKLEGKLNVDERQTFKNELVVFTIGHSIHSLEKLVNLLKRNRIEVVVDIRSQPYSRNVPHFNKDNLEKEIKKSGLKYLFLGKELGGRPSERQFYDQEGFVLYSKIAESPEFKTGLERLLNGIERFRVALMCSEENPMNCHRRLLVGRVLASVGVEVLHIRADGSIQSEEQILSDQYKRNGDMNQQSLFVGEEPLEWKSTQSVLQRKPPNNSSAH
jgi:uncharacterized protein (DUF488 family)